MEKKKELSLGELIDTILKIKETKRFKTWLAEVQEDKKYEKKFVKLFEKKYGIRYVGEVPALPKKDEDEFEEVTKKVKKVLSEAEAIQREIGIRLVRKRSESLGDYLKRLKKAKEEDKKNKKEEKL